jgi:sulfate adenylyltransferase subunit 2
MGRKNQRPELFDLLNGKIENGQNVRVFQFRTGPS